MKTSVYFYERLFGTKLIAGAALILLALIASAFWGEARLDGVLSLHFVNHPNIWLIISDLAINLVSLGLTFGIGQYLSTQRFPRLMDLIPQLIWAQWPLIPLCLLSFLFNFQQLNELAQQGVNSEELAIMLSSGPFWLSLVFLLSGIVLHIHFLYGLFKVDSGLKGPKLTWTFTLSLIAAMILSITLISSFSL